MSLYAEYILERTNDLIVETESGFATYRYINDNKTCYIVDIYTVPSERKKGAAALLADHIALEAKEKGCTELWGTVVPSAKGATASLRVLLAYGFELLSSTDNLIVFRKGL